MEIPRYQPYKRMQSDAAKLAPLMRSVIRLREMRTFALAFLLFVTAGCSIGVTVHDEDRASELIVDFLSSLKTDQGIQLAYDWTDDRFKKEVSPDKFAQIVSTIRQKNYVHKDYGSPIYVQVYMTVWPQNLKSSETLGSKLLSFISKLSADHG